jgi:hypothetical protein
LAVLLPFTGGTGTTNSFGITSSGGWPLCGFGFGTGAAGVWNYTPVQSTRLEVRVQGPIRCPGAVNVACRIQYGTGGGPAFGGSGGQPVPYGQNMLDSLTVYRALHLMGIASNLTIGTQYWFDLGLNTQSVAMQFPGNTGPVTPMTWTVQEI